MHLWIAVEYPTVVIEKRVRAEIGAILNEGISA